MNKLRNEKRKEFNLASRIKIACEAKGISHAELANRSNLSKSFISRLLNQERYGISYDRLCDLVEALDISLYSLLELPERATLGELNDSLKTLKIKEVESIEDHHFKGEYSLLVDEFIDDIKELYLDYMDINDLEYK